MGPPQLLTAIRIKWIACRIGALLAVSLASNFLAATNVRAQSNTFPSSGYVGIGTTSPDEKLVISGSGGYNGLEILNTQSSNGLYLFDDGDPHIEGNANATLWINDDSNGSVGINGSGGNTFMNVYNGGNVGIGTTAPNYKLDVNGSINIEAGNSLYFGDDQGVEWITASWGVGLHGDVTHPIYSPDASVLIGYRPLGNNYGTGNLLVSGNVGIGTANPTYPLSVNGTIEAKEVIVQTGWSDYVFDPTYRLAPLADVEHSIKSTHHLPGIPSATDVAEHGVKAGAMEAKLLGKIEELTLYVIQEQKQLNAQSAEIRDEVDPENWTSRIVNPQSGERSTCRRRDVSMPAS